MRRLRSLAVAVVALLSTDVRAATAKVAPPSPRPSVADSFRLGSGGTSLCQVQGVSNDAGAPGMFDRGYSIACRDAAAPIGRVYALRDGSAAGLAKLPALTCQAETPAALADTPGATVAQCAAAGSEVPWRRYLARKGRTTYVAQGLAGYDSALTLALRSVYADKVLPGEVSIAVTEAGDAAAFARVQAGSLDLDQALAEGYRRNNGGNYAEAAEFFDVLLQRRMASNDPNRRYGEYIVNQALQKSNLGEFAEADALFREAHRIPTADPVELRLRRNLEAINHLNQERLEAAMRVLDTPVAPVGGVVADKATIDEATARAINSDAPLAQELGVAQGAVLTPQEKAAILDAQAVALRGSVMRLRGDRAASRAAFGDMLLRIQAIRGGNIASLARLRAQTLGELAALDETEKNPTRAEAELREAAALLESEYPGSAAVNAAHARLGAFLARNNRPDESLALYREVVRAATESGGAAPGFEGLLAPYFTLLTQQVGRNPALAGDFFAAAQTLVRPGLAETQAILTRELSGGDDAAAGLFRQSVTLGREIERQRVVLVRLAAIEQATPEDNLKLQAARDALAQLQADQVGVQARLSAFPRYRAISTRGTTLAELQQTLRPGEAYWKLLVVGGRVYGFYATPGEARVWAAAIGALALDKTVDQIRDSIAATVNGRLETHPFDVVAARKLYVALTGPVAGDLAKAKTLIFEPDGAMLRLPANLLVTDQAGVDAYVKQADIASGDPFDFRGVAWLGRNTDISTSVSARAFEDVRRTPPSTAAKTYLGLGHNAPVPAILQLTGAAPPPPGVIDCSWPLASWSNPISPKELLTAQSIVGADTSKVITGEGFSDTAIKASRDLAGYRVIHFATHGLVAAPRPACPARPALLTSFGGAGSDGLLTFAEIYDLKLDADLVILSACDTAGSADVAATREAGVTSGGGRALDGLVRAFIGAGSRSVLATHWVAPDDFNATERLVSGLFEAPRGTPIVEALRQAQVKLMDAADTSHPYYWSAFALVGDGAQPVLRAQ